MIYCKIINFKVNFININKFITKKHKIILIIVIIK